MRATGLKCRRSAVVRGLPIIALVALAVPPAEAGTQQIPLEPGLVVTTATHDVVTTATRGGEDYEVLRSVKAMDAKTVTFDLHRVEPAEAGRAGRQAFSVIRVVRREDLKSANRMVAYFHSEDPELFPGSTAFQASAALLEQIKSGADTPFVFGMAAGPLGILGARKYYRGTLKLAEPVPVPVSLLLNGERTELAAIHAKGTLVVGDDVGEGEFWWLDQADNALSLRWTFKDSIVQVVRIDTPTAPTERQVARVATGLASSACRAELHGVYFDTGSAALLAQSAAAIAEVAKLLASEPAWRVTIEGHTDNIGSDADNQRLSQDRVDAVRKALIDRHGIAADRLTATGFGESRPVESNDTVEGRAHNRRVELSRQCP